MNINYSDWTGRSKLEYLLALNILHRGINPCVQATTTSTIFEEMQKQFYRITAEPISVTQNTN